MRGKIRSKNQEQGAVKKRGKALSWKKYAGMILSLAIGAVGGFGIAVYLLDRFGEDLPPGQVILTFFLFLLMLYGASFVQVVLHEAGHLLFGLLSGYGFSSFRIMSLMWVKEGGRIRFRRLSLAGTGGQCLMIPPEGNWEELPVFLYNLGGSLMNLMTGAVFLGLCFVAAERRFLSTALLFLAILGFLFAVINGVPLSMGMVNNDGYNAWALRKSGEARRSFWVQMKVNEQIARGVRLKDMPEEWFEVPSDEAMKDSMAAVMGVFACNRLMDARRFEEADRLMEHLLGISSGMVGLHRSLLICDRMYCELIGENRRQYLEEMRGEEQKKFMKSMKNFPGVLRTEYAYALLAGEAGNKADKIKKQFEKCAKTYPYPSEVQAERELMELARRRAKQEENHVFYQCV